MAELHKLLDQQ
ncbi:hypothetical protein DS834_06320 [Lactobacillus bombicola]|uniref:Uncharacterized protein n=1 Tax=Lactobacillus bombicola TaxID=1505723 RepID=A0ABX9LUF5_9LACO|nr:hypothetical protein DS834_06320 [Lactobacillus bombicola]